MATFLQGQTDQFGPLQLYKPDYTFLTEVYGTRQAEYDKGFNLVKNLYNSQLNSSLTSEDNIAYRQETFKKIQNSLKNVSGIDLSNPTNVMHAKSLINPIADDKELAYDVALTAANANAKSQLNSVRNSTDPNVRKTFNPYSEKAIALSENDLRKSKRGDGSITQIRPGEFIPYEDMIEFLNKSAKEQGIKVEVTKAGTEDNPYTITYKNGAMSYGAFNQWAKTQIGNRFDKQIQQQAHVESESAIRGEMESKGIGREDAMRNIAKALSDNIIKQTAENGIESTKGLKEIEAEISKVQKEYPSGVPEKYKNEWDSLIAKRDAYKKVLEDAKEENAKVTSQYGPDYVMSNLPGIYFNEIKGNTAGRWAKTYADATTTQTLKPDQVILSERKNKLTRELKQAELAQRESQFQRNYNQKEKQFEEGNALKLKIAQMHAAASGKGKKGGAGSTEPTETYLGTVQSASTVAGVDVLMENKKANKESMFNHTFAADNGLMNLVIKDPKNYNRYNAVIQKVNTIAQGGTDTLTKDEQATLAAMAGEAGLTSIKNPKTARDASAVVDNLINGFYERGTKAVAYYTKMGKSSTAAKYLPAFNNILASMKSEIDEQTSIRNNAARIASEVTATDASGNFIIKDAYKGAKIIGYQDGKIPIIDFTDVEQSKREFLNNILSSQYAGKTRPYGDVIQLNGMNPSEMFNIINSNFYKSVTDQNGNKLGEEALAKFRNINLDSVTDLFGDNAIVSFDPATKMVKFKLQIAPESKAAKAATQGGMKSGTYTFEVPMETIKSNDHAFKRIIPYINKNMIESRGAGELNAFIQNPGAYIEAPSYYTHYGVDYNVSVAKDASGASGLQFNFEFFNPTTKKPFTTTFFQKGDVADPTFLRSAQTYLNTQIQNYLSQRIQNDDAVYSKGNYVDVDYDNLDDVDPADGVEMEETPDTEDDNSNED